MPLTIGSARAILQQQPWTPADLGQQLVGWWDARVGITQSGGTVSAWADTTTLKTVSQATGSLQPAYSLTALNGATPGLTFDGTDDVLTMTNTTGLPTGATPSWIFFLGSQTLAAADTVTRNAVAYGGANANRALQRAVSGGVNRARVSTGDGAAPVNLTDTAADLSGVCILFGAFSATAESGRVNGAAFSPASQAVVPATLTNRFRIGATALAATAANFWQGVASQALVGTGTLTTAQVQLLEGWAAWLALDPQILPADHPYRYRRP